MAVMNLNDVDKNWSIAINPQVADSWDKYFDDLMKVVASKSKDPDTKVGSVIVGYGHEIKSTGYNGFCRNVNELDFPTRWQRPEKYFWVEHAERNAIYNAARNGVCIDGSTIYATIGPCVDCAKAIIQTGLREVNINYQNQLDRDKYVYDMCHGDKLKFSKYKDEMEKIRTMFDEGYVNVRYYEVL